MSINRAENSLEDKLLNKLAGMERDIREMKSAIQPIGGDALDIEATPMVQAASLTIAAGGAATFNITAIPGSQTLTLWNFLWTMYIDGLADANQWPSNTAGTSTLSAAQRSIRAFAWIDWADSSDSTNVRVHKIRVENPDTASHTVTIKLKAYLPRLTGAAAS